MYTICSHCLYKLVLQTSVTGKFCLKQVTAVQQARPETSNCYTEAKPKNEHFLDKN